MKNILIFIRYLDLTPFTYQEILHLRKNHKVKVLCEKVNIDDRLPKDCIIRYRPPKASIKTKIQQFLIRHDLWLGYHHKDLENQFTQVIKDFKPDIVQCHYGDDALIWLDNASVDIATIVMFHGYDASAWLRNSTYIRKYKKIFRRDFVHSVTCSKNMQTRMKSAGLPMQKNSVIYYGIDTSVFIRTDKNKVHKKIFLQLSVFREKKGVLYTLSAFKQFLEQYPDKPFHLILAGDGALRNSIEEYIKENGLQEYVSLPGWQDMEGAKQLMNDAHFFVHHSITPADGDMEGIPNVIIEAMAMELPVITTYHSGIPELVEDKVNGRLVNERDVESYAEAINEIMSYSYLKTNRQKIVNQFNLNRRNQEIEELLVQKAN